MHPDKTFARNIVEQESSVVFSFIPNTEGGPLLRKKDRFPRHYGRVVYQDPYLDFVVLDVVTSDSTKTLWAGSHAQCHEIWEPFLPDGAA
jgi:hypothetical protein